MAIFDQERFRLSGAAPPSGLRAEAEAYAASLGQVRGTSGWGDAVRDYVLNLSVRRSGADSSPSTTAAGEPAGIALAQLPPELSPGRYRVPELMGRPRHGFEEDEAKLPGDFWSVLPRPPFAPKGPPGRRTPGELEKRHFTTAPRELDSAPMAGRMQEGVRRLPEERRRISARDNVALSASPELDRYYSTMLVKERGIKPDGTFRISPKGAVGPGQILPGTAREVAGRLGMAFDDWRFRHDQAYNEMLGQAYYKDLVRQFGGDFVKAAAAYNAGPAAAKRAIQAARKTARPGEWEKNLPRETREYVEFLRKFNHLPGE